ncbi:MAG: aldehyde ferredoxin oxidoreductase C-terminal domain-containing protein, partial [Thermodesulfobacteriota bacterium]|nr:aldehyde ferredoxin oxidoreductase C-terminal domain-containing protein [Thermodesulfobacteriota bacterium]
LEPISGDWSLDNMWVRNLTCSNSCMVHCADWWKIKGDETPLAHLYAGECGDKPEYVYVASMGILTDIIDLPTCAHLSNLCNKYGADMFEIGNTMGFLMHLDQEGLITKEDTGGVHFEWGSVEAAEETLHRVLGPGDIKDKMKDPLFELLYEGVYEAAVKLERRKGIEALKYACYGKGHSPHLGDMRAGTTFGTTFATSNRGCDHLRVIYILDRLDPIEATMPAVERFFKDDPFVKEKGLDYRKAAYMSEPEMAGVRSGKFENVMAINNCLGTCVFAWGIAGILTVTPADLADAYTCLTGIELSEEDLWDGAKRATNMEKAFNTLTGLTKEDDTVCYRWMNEPTTGGWAHNQFPNRYPNETGKGMKMADYLENTKSEYYEYRGYDPETSLQTKDGLKELGLDEIADYLEKEGKLAEQVKRKAKKENKQ